MRRALPAVVVVLLVVGLLTWMWPSDRDGSDDDGRDPAPTAVVAAERYLTALEHRDRAAVAALAPPGYDASDEIDGRLERYGGIRAGARTALSSDIAPGVMTLRIRATAAGGSPLRWTENLVRRPQGWYVVLGSAAGAGKPPSSTTMP